jgi:hypothetical protein
LANDQLDKKASSRWRTLNVAMEHFQSHLREKTDAGRFRLDLIDLLHVSNFKGGNSSITEPIVSLRDKLVRYERGLAEIASQFDGLSLGKLDKQTVEVLSRQATEFIRPLKPRQLNISGFGPSYASALLSAHFPDLLPVIDRRILNGAGIKVDIDSSGQVKVIEQHYTTLLRACWLVLKKEPQLVLRELDRRWFCVPMIARE